MQIRRLAPWIGAALYVSSLAAQAPPKVTPPLMALGFRIGDDYRIAGHRQLDAYWKRLAAESARFKLESLGRTSEGREQYMAIITSPANQRNLARYREIARKLALAQDLTPQQARALAREGKAVVWIDGGIHANETSGYQQLIEMAYQMASRSDEETLRFLNDTILLCVEANPDGADLVADWYMRAAEPAKRSLNNLPRLYQKYAGHDNNRDFYMANLPETTNMARVLFQEWFPQIVYDHHQSAPSGAVVFMPPFRDPFSYHVDALALLGVQMVGTAMHSRLVAEGKGGGVMRGAGTFSSWWNGGVRTAATFHNMLGILTEIAGSPNPSELPLVPESLLRSGDSPMPVGPRVWRFRETIDYEIAINRAVLDFASRYRETLLFDIYQMGRNSIEKGSRDNWTVTPKRVAALEAAAAGAAPTRGLYEKAIHDPALRDPRGYVLPSDQPDFPTAIQFANALIKNGVAVLKARSAFRAGEKEYPAGSLVVKTAQAFRPHIMDMFEPQDYPNDVQFPGGPPTPPYDIAGWTLAYQMGVAFDRILEGFEGPFEKVSGLLPAPAAPFEKPPSAGFLLDHRVLNSFIATNRLLKAGCPVYWLAEDGPAGRGAIWVPDSAAARGIVEQSARELGVPARALAERPRGQAWQLRPVRIGLFDQYGGLSSAGWTRFVLERYEFPFEVVYPRELDAGNLKSRFDVIVLSDGAGSRQDAAQPAPNDIPEQYRGRLGRISNDRTIPQLKSFLAGGGAAIAIGDSISLAAALGAQIETGLGEIGADGKRAPLPADRFYVPGSLLRASVDNAHPLAYGMPAAAHVFFNNSPAFQVLSKGASVAASYPNEGPLLDSGWAVGAERLKGRAVAAEVPLGDGKLILIGPDPAFRGQSYGMFQLLLNAALFGGASRVDLN